MAERQFAVIGHPIGHTMSPFIHKRLFELAGECGEYGIIDVAPEELPVKIKDLDKLAGYNITIPNKQHIIPFLDRLDKKAQLYGSVNTVKNGNVREGFTTDPDGFLKSLEAAGIPFAGDVTVLGCGGVARTIVYEAALAGCRLKIAVRPEDVALRDALAADVRSKIDGANVETCLLSELGSDSGLLVNCTPLGMYPKTDTIAVGDDVISKYEYVYDVVYNPMETLLVKKAKANGSTASGGMSMLVWQAVVAHEIWDGTVYNTDDIRQLVEDSAKEMKKTF